MLEVNLDEDLDSSCERSDCYIDGRQRESEQAEKSSLPWKSFQLVKQLK